MKRKTRKQKAENYSAKFGHIPIDYKERLSWLYDSMKISNTEAYDILDTHRQMVSSLEYQSINIILFEIPEGSPRPRFRIINRSNLSNMALSNPNFVHVYSLTGYEDNVYMKRLVTEQELEGLNSVIYTPCIVDMNAYLKTPNSFNRKETILSEVGLIRPITKPDWDNIEKKYSDMLNKNVWLDDTLVVDGAIHRYYSVLPRIEIRIKFLNQLYNKHQYNQMINRVDFDNTNDISYFGQE